MNKIFNIIVFISFVSNAIAQSNRGADTELSEQRVALVIGNSKYNRLERLKNPKNDADAVHQALRELNFKSDLLKDATKRQLDSSFQAFKNKILGYKAQGKRVVALLYYAGHGVHWQNETQLLGLEAVNSEDTNAYLGIASLRKQLKDTKSDLNIFIIDACRTVTGDNPPLYWQGLYGNGNPITPDAPATGTFLAYSTCIGNKAPDFKVKDNNHAQSPNSPYTTVLLKLMRIPNFTIEQTFDSLKYQVDTLPAYETEMIGRFCFNPKLISNRDKKDTVIQHHFNTVRTIAFSSDATRMITGGWDNRLLCYDVSNQRVLYEVANGPYDDKITSVAMSPDNQYFAVSSTDSTIKLYRLSDGDWIHTWKDAQGMMMTVHFSPDGKYLAAGGHDMQVYVYRIRDKQLVYALGQHTDRVHQVRFSPNGQYLATASLDKTVLLYPTSNFDAPQLLSEYEAGMNVVSFSPNGRYLAVGGIDKKVHLYQVWNKRLLHTFENHTENIYSVCFSPDNKFMASAGEDGKVHIYELTNYSLVETLSDHGDWVYQVCFSPKGQLLVTASKDRTLRLYRKH